MHWFAKIVEKLSWRSHRYTGLALLGLFWIFALSGLLLNHSNWSVSLFWPSREITRLERPITPPAGETAEAMAANLMEQLGISGELENARIRAGGDSLIFNVGRPGKPVRVDVSLRDNMASLEINRTNLVGVGMMLHTFTGVRARQPESVRDWALTKTWSAAIDILAIGMLLLVIGGLVISFRRAEDFYIRLAVFAMGILVCCFFLFGLQWLY